MSKNNHMICDMETGVCGPAEQSDMEWMDFKQPNEVIDLYYVTDPICSHCWALEPTLRRFTEQYGDYFQMKTVMGGLLESWDGFADVSNGIHQASDVAKHWQEVGEVSRMPINGSLWLDNPVHSSYPPSQVYKVIQQASQKLATRFLRQAREAVFVFNENIADDDILTKLVDDLGLDGKAIMKEAKSTHAVQLLKEDFQLARELGVRGFPTIIMVNKENQGVKLVGARSVEDYVNGLTQVLSTDTIKPKNPPKLATLLKQEHWLFSKEIETMYNVEQKDIRKFITNELKTESYEIKEILGETYVELKTR